MMSSRQLAVIMFTDIVSYSKIMGLDEQKALGVLKQNRELQLPLIKNFNGCWIKEIGDGVLASFKNVSDAVNSAIAIQKQCSATTDFQLRIGIHLGEVVFDKNDVFGDGVNIASRIQTIAEPGTIYISQAVNNNVINKKEITTKYIKQEKLKNILEPINIYEIYIEQNPPSPVSSPFNTPPVAKKNSIAVLPFVNMSNDPNQEFFCDGIAEEIINTLAHLDNLRVISRTSAFSFKGKNMNVSQIGKKLNVTNLLEGSVRKAGKRLRITTKLVKVSDESNLWSNRYDRELEDIFSIQDDIATNVATELKGFLTHQERNTIQSRETNFEAYAYYLRGRQYFHGLLLDKSKEMFEKAINFDPHYAPAYAGLADTHSMLYSWEGADELNLLAAEEYSLKALSLAPNSSDSHSSHGFVLGLGNKYDDAEKEFMEAIRLNENSFDAYYYFGRLCFSRGLIEESTNYFFKASQVRLEDFQSVLLLAQSLKMIGRMDQSRDMLLEGIDRARKQLEINPTDVRALSIASGSLFEIGKKKEAFQWMKKALLLQPDNAGVLINGACLNAKSGNTEEALTLLENAFGKGYGKKEWIENDPDYESIRDHPRFKSLLNSLK